MPRLDISFIVLILLTTSLMMTGIASTSEIEDDFQSSGSGFDIDLTGRDLPGTGGVFIENMGQISRDDIEFYTMWDHMLGFGTSRIVHCLNAPYYGEFASYAFEITFEGSNDVSPSAEERTGTNYNFIKEKTMTSFSYSRIVYHDLYPGIDLAYHFKDGQLKYDFIVDPFVDPGIINMKVHGAQTQVLDPNEMVFRTPLGDLIDEGLIGLQGDDGIDVGFQMRSFGMIGFDVSEYDHSRTLVIDPFLRYSTYFGGTKDDYEATETRIDPWGNIYLAGTARSSDFPVTSGVIDTTYSNDDGFLVKFSPDLSKVLFMTFFGGNMEDNVYDIYLDENSNVYLTGRTFSKDFPTTSDSYDPFSSIWTDSGGATYSDAFVSKISSNGTSLSYSTFIGGDGNDLGSCLDVDDDGFVYVGGSTFSENFPTKDPFQANYSAGGVMGAFAPDGFILKLDPTGSSLNYSTYLGGAHNRFESGIDDIWDIEVDGKGSAVVCGQTGGYDFPTTTGAFKELYRTDMGFVTKLAKNGSALDFSTFLAETTKCSGLKIDDEGVIYVTGDTMSSNFPVSQNAYSRNFMGGPNDAFVTALSSDGSKVEYSSYLGGSEPDESVDIEIDEDGFVWICGTTISEYFPEKISSKNFKTGQSGEAFVTRFKRDLSALDFSFKFGGTYFDNGIGIEVNSTEDFVLNGATLSSDISITSNAYDTTLNGNANEAMDLFISRFDNEGSLPLKPLNLSIETGDRSLNISWSDPDQADNDGVLAYKIYRSTAEVSMKAVGEVQRDHPWFNDTGLINGKEYTYKVRALNHVGEGASSELISGIPMGLPSAPVNPVVIPGDSSLTIEWSQPYDMGGASTVTYDIERGEDSFSILTSDIGSTSFVHNGLTNGKEYYYRILARNPFGVSNYTEVISGIPGRTPSPPLDLKAIRGDGYLAISWEPPADDGGLPVLNYSIYTSHDNVSFSQIADGVQDNHYNITPLENGKKRYVRVTAVNSIGEGSPSIIEEAIPLGLPSEPLGLEASYFSTMVDLRWDPPLSSGGSSSILYEVLMAEEGEELELFLDGIQETQIRIENLENGIRYRFGVRARNPVGAGPLSNTVLITPYGLPSKVVELSAEPLNSSISLHWSEPESNGGFDELDYVVFYGTSKDVLSERLDTSSMDLMVTGLQNGVEYHFMVISRNPEGNGPASEVISSIPMGLPSAPHVISVVPGNGSIEIEWQIPADMGGADEVSYVVYISGTGDDLVIYQDNISSTSLVIVDLENGAEYQIGIRAVNLFGSGHISEIVHSTPGTIPDPPIEITIAFEGINIKLQWSSPLFDGGSPITSYRVYRGADGTEMVLLSEVGPSTTMFTDDDIEENIVYRYRITALNEYGEGAGSNEVSISKEKEESSSNAMFFIALSISFVVLIAAALGTVLFIRSRYMKGKEAPNSVEDSDVDMAVDNFKADTVGEN